MVVGMHPTHAIEREYIAENGLDAFWELEWDPYDVARPPAVQLVREGPPVARPPSRRTTPDLPLPASQLPGNA